MATKRNIGNDLRPVQPDIVDRKLDELVKVLYEEPVTPVQLYHLQRQFIESVHAHPAFRQMEGPVVIAGDRKSRHLQNPTPEHSRLGLTFRVIVSLLIIMLGFAMIVLPQPASFEIYTLFLFNEQDGFTLMDLISLLIVFTGIYFLVTAVSRNQRTY